jgi:hypothetical protein
MAINVNEAVQKIKAKGAKNVRIVPMNGQSISGGDYQIELMETDSKIWQPLVSGIKKKMAEDLVNQAINKVILG